MRHRWVKWPVLQWYTDQAGARRVASNRAVLSDPDESSGAFRPGCDNFQVACVYLEGWCAPIRRLETGGYPGHRTIHRITDVERRE